MEMGRNIILILTWKRAIPQLFYLPPTCCLITKLEVLPLVYQPGSVSRRTNGHRRNERQARRGSNHTLEVSVGIWDGIWRHPLTNILAGQCKAYWNVPCLPLLKSGSPYPHTFKSIKLWEFQSIMVVMQRLFRTFQKISQHPMGGLSYWAFKHESRTVWTTFKWT